MIYALTQEPEKYNLGNTGLYYNYGHDPHLFCLMSMTSPVFFLWEDLFEDLPTSSRVVRLDLKQEEAYIKTLEQEIGGRTVPELMEHMSPREFAEFLKVAQPLDLEVVKTFGLPKPEANLAALYMSTHIRALQHEKFYRGKIYKEGNKTEIAFKSRLTKQEDEYLEKAKAEFRRQYLIKIGAKA
jgi:hypothetical protein